MNDYTWRKASRSGTNGDACVEVATNVAGVVALRDSKDRSGPRLTVDSAAWRAFVAALR